MMTEDWKKYEEKTNQQFNNKALTTLLEQQTHDHNDINSIWINIKNIIQSYANNTIPHKISHFKQDIRVKKAQRLIPAYLYTQLRRL
jgi:hypothetical protein